MNIINPTEISIDDSFYSENRAGLFEFEFRGPINKNYRFPADNPHDAVCKLQYYQRIYQGIIKHRLNKGILVRIKLKRFNVNIEDTLEV